MKEATKRARAYLTFNVIDFLYRAADQRPYTRKELFRQTLDPNKLANNPELGKESRNTRWQSSILKTLVGRKVLKEVTEDGQQFYSLDNLLLARMIIEEWEDDNGMLVRGLVFPNEVEFEAYYAKRFGNEITEDQQVPMPPKKDETNVEAELVLLGNEEAEAVIRQNVKDPGERFIARSIFLLTSKYNDSTATLNGLLERMIDAVSDVKQGLSTVASSILDMDKSVAHKLGEMEKKTGGYNKRLELVDRHVNDLSGVVRSAAAKANVVDTGQIVTELRGVLEPLLTQQKPEKLAETVAEAVTDLLSEVQRNTATVKKLQQEHNQRNSIMKLLANSMAANIKEAEALRLLILEQYGEKK